MKKTIICFILLVFLIGLFSTVLAKQEKSVDCCKACTDYCKCQDGYNGEHGCYTVACPGGAPDCSGVGVKCCYPDGG